MTTGPARAGNAVVWAALLLVAVIRRPGHLFELPRAQPLLWLAVVVLYPPLSAYSQEVSIGVHNVPAMLLATAGGLLFASTYERRRSTLLVAIEHALCGDFVFTIGLAGLFYNARRWISMLAQ